MRVRYGGTDSVLVRGPVTGADYRFSRVEDSQLVEPRDAVALVRNPLFRIVGVVRLPVTEGAGGDGGRHA
jgi:hypothetical protein